VSNANSQDRSCFSVAFRKHTVNKHTQCKEQPVLIVDSDRSLEPKRKARKRNRGKERSSFATETTIKCEPTLVSVPDFDAFSVSTSGPGDDSGVTIESREESNEARSISSSSSCSDASVKRKANTSSGKTSIRGRQNRRLTKATDESSSSSDSEENDYVSARTSPSLLSCTLTIDVKPVTGERIVSKEIVKLENESNEILDSHSSVNGEGVEANQMNREEISFSEDRVSRQAETLLEMEISEPTEIEF
jgi:hypothetical protein